MPTIAEVQLEKLRRERLEARLAHDVVDECRIQLMLKFRFLDLALWRMGLQDVRNDDRYPLGTDAKSVFFDPTRIISRYKDNSFDECVRDYLHMVMHCIFRHPFDTDHEHQEAWGLACDVIVESAAMEMCGGRFESEFDKERQKLLWFLRRKVDKLTPAKLYFLFKEAITTPRDANIDKHTLADIRFYFERDNHGPWPANNDAKSDGVDTDDPEEPEDKDAGAGGDEENQDSEASINSDGSGDSSDNDAQQQLDDEQHQGQEQGDDNATGDMESNTSGGDSEAGSEQQQKSELEKSDNEPEDDGSGMAGSGSGYSERQEDEVDDRADEEVEKEWEDLAKQMEMDLETFSKEWGNEAGNLLTSLKVANRDAHDYSKFLRQFMAPSEEMIVNQDEFDYIFYTYGMNLYGNMPLVEPLEYVEINRVREFVIAIDTSESVKGELVKLFIEHTFEILKESKDFAEEVNIHLIQCDNRIRQDIKLTNLKQIDKIMEKFYVRGFGGTDFRPVFDYVRGLQYDGDLKDLKGLIYFTDGEGRFPNTPPGYDTAFVFMDNDGTMLPNVPPWAMKIVIDEFGIRKLKNKSGNDKDEDREEERL